MVGYYILLLSLNPIVLSLAIILGLHRTAPREADVRRPEEANDMPEGHAVVNRHAELYAVDRPPKLDHRRKVLLLVVPVLPASVPDPIDRVPRRARHDLLAGVIRREVEEGQMHEYVERDHLRRGDHARAVLQLVRQRQPREALARGEPPRELVHHEPILEAPEVREAEHHEDGVALAVDVVDAAPFDDHLHHDVGRRRLRRGDAQLQEEGVALREGFGGVSAAADGRFRRRVLGGGGGIGAADGAVVLLRAAGVVGASNAPPQAGGRT